MLGFQVFDVLWILGIQCNYFNLTIISVQSHKLVIDQMFFKFQIRSCINKYRSFTHKRESFKLGWNIEQVQSATQERSLGITFIVRIHKLFTTSNSRVVHLRIDLNNIKEQNYCGKYALRRSLLTQIFKIIL